MSKTISEINSVWESIKSSLKLQNRSNNVFLMLLDELKIRDISDNNLTLESPSKVNKNILISNYLDIIQETASKLYLPNSTINIITADEIEQNSKSYTLKQNEFFKKLSLF